MLERTDWKTAPPLWRAALDGAHDLDRPALLGFSNDDFMERFQGELDKTAEERDVTGFVAKPETWRAGETPDDLKLYQPAHGRFYLVSAALVCARYGLPDRAVDAGKEEAVFFVLRRLEPNDPDQDVDVDQPDSYRELGWSAGQTPRWVAANGSLVTDEERLPMFASAYDDGSRRRRVFAGLVPVGAREKYEGGVVAEAPAGTSDDPLAALADERLVKLEAGIVGLQALDPASIGTTDNESLDLVREAMFFSTLDLATFIHDHLDAVWGGASLPSSVGSLPAFGGGLTTDRLATTFDGVRSWRAALTEAYDAREAVLSPPEPPPEPVTGMTTTEMATAIGNLGISAGDLTPPVPEPLGPVETEFFAECLAVLPAAAPEVESEGEPEPESEASFTDGAVYVIKCVYHRPKCPPSQQVQMSPASAPFRLSHYYDPDAPYRDTTIPMPVDTSLEGLRKFPNAVKVAISAQLRRQMDRVQTIKLGDLDDGNIPDEKPGLDLGMVCSLSIPIITICALILLMIIVSLLNIVFFWMPLFKICRPKVGP